MTLGGHVVLNKSNNCLDNYFRAFRGTRRFFDAGFGKHRNRRFKILGFQIPGTGEVFFFFFNHKDRHTSSLLFQNGKVISELLSHWDN